MSPITTCAKYLGTVMLSVIPFLLGLCGYPGLQAFGAESKSPTYHSLVTAFHVHSTWSTGSLTLNQLAERSQRFGIDAVVLAENFALRYEYGLPPLRKILRHSYTIPSLSADSIQPFLSDVAQVQTAYPDVLMIPGVEVAPHYYWTGSLLSGDLTMHNSQRNLLVFGLQNGEDYTKLPASGNAASFHHGWSMLVSMLPVLLFLPAGWYWFRRSRSRRKRRKFKMIGGGLAVVALLLTMNAWPFGEPLYSTYDDQLGFTPYQTLIDHVAGKEGMIVWSLPEARDSNAYSFGALGTVQVKTDPHPEALVQTTGFSGFGGVYQDTRHIHDPGGIWDLTLGQYLAGHRHMVPYLFGEIAFHVPGQAGIELNQVLNVLWVKERSMEGMMEAMQQGRFYAVGQYKPGIHLRLDEFHVQCPIPSCQAGMGETLQLSSAQDLSVVIKVSATDQQAYPVSLKLVQSGTVLSKVTGHTPLQHVFQSKYEKSWRPFYYRVEINGPGEILSNPIFVIPPPQDQYVMNQPGG